MASTNYVCPKCGSDNIQSFKSIYESGTRTVTRQGRDSDGNIQNYQAVEYTNNLAESVAPPAQIKYGPSPFTVGFWVGVIAGLVIYYISGEALSISGFGYRFGVRGLIGYFVVPLVIGIILGVIAKITMGQKYKEKCARIDMDNRKAREKWEHSWVCMRCSNRFVM